VCATVCVCACLSLHICVCVCVCVCACVSGHVHACLRVRVPNPRHLSAHLSLHWHVLIYVGNALFRDLLCMPMHVCSECGISG
jgi:hypothetical protein